MNLANISNKERIARAEFRCVHHHNGFSHPRCFDKGNRLINNESIGFLDIETTGFQADFGIVLSYCIQPMNGDMLYRVITPGEIQCGKLDKNITEQFCKDVRKFDRIVTYNGCRFDIPFLRVRCIYWKHNFPIFREIKHTDLYLVAKSRLRTHNKRQGTISKFFGIPAKAHPINPEIWFKCLSGNKKALDYVLVHNKEDVLSLRELYIRLQNYFAPTQTSI